MTNGKAVINQYLEMSSDMYEQIWDMWMSNRGILNRSQVQMSDFYRNYLDQAHQANSDNTRAYDDMVKRVMENQTQMLDFLDTSLKSVLKPVQFTGFECMNPFCKKSDE